MSALLASLLAAPDSRGGDSFRRHAEPASTAEEIARREEVRREERALVARLRHGDSDALRELVETSFHRLSRFANGILRQPDLADDIAQDVLTSLWEQREQFSLTQSLKAYLFTAVRNRALNELKHAQVQSRTQPVLAESVEYSQQPATDPIARLHLETLVSQLKIAIDELPERRKTAIRLRYDEGMTYPAIAEVLGVSVKSAEQLVALTVQALRKRLWKFL